jgi:DNA-binding NarL/FixJ family response regulator
VVEERIIRDLTPREKTVLDMAAHGNTNKAIAFKLGISDQTVKSHMTDILIKLGAKDRANAVFIYYKQEVP